MTDLSTTSYAILGQLALRPWSPYELAHEMTRNLRYFWPRAESHIYTESKRLAELGLARTVAEHVGKRRRLTYTITPAGEQALQRWLDRPAKPISLEFESLLRVLLGQLGSKDQLLAAVDQAAADVDELVDIVRPRIAREYLEGRAPFQQHVHVRAFVFDFLTDFGLMVKSWAARTRTEIERWDDVSPEGKTERAIALIRAAAAR